MGLLNRYRTADRIRKAREAKLREYNSDDEDMLKYIKEYEDLCKKKYESDNEELAQLLKLIARQNLQILAELKKINDVIPDPE